MVGGQWLVREGVHVHEEQALAGYRRTVQRKLGLEPQETQARARKLIAVTT